VKSFLPLLPVLIAFALAGAVHAEELFIIANPAVEPPERFGLQEVEAIYLLRQTVWPDGTHIVPVNREATSDIRAEFTVRVLNQDNTSLARYWNEMHFQGKLPPVVQESERAMLAFIRKVPGAIGYVGGSIPPADVRVLARVP
jgi:ABC-type phosphate transport system substrate-binding protein